MNGALCFTLYFKNNAYILPYVLLRCSVFLAFELASSSFFFFNCFIYFFLSFSQINHTPKEGFSLITLVSLCV